MKAVDPALAQGAIHGKAMRAGLPHYTDWRWNAWGQKVGVTASM